MRNTFYEAALTDFAAQLHELEQRTDAALGSLEQDEKWAEALAVYRAAGVEVDALDIPRPDAAYKDARRIRAYLYLREANALRALGRSAEADPLGHLELEAAMASGDSITIARSMFSLGSTYLANGDLERGMKFMDASKPMFEHKDAHDHRQGLGWWYLIQADISNGGLARTGPQYAREMANTALEILRPLDNWPGIARAHAARAKACERSGDLETAKLARAAQKMAEEMMRMKGPGEKHERRD